MTEEQRQELVGDFVARLGEALRNAAKDPAKDFNPAEEEWLRTFRSTTEENQ